MIDPPSDPLTPLSDGGGQDRPLDLLPVREAAALVDRSVSTVKGWLRSGKLSKWREDPSSKASRAMVSRAELMAYAAGELVPSPPRPGSGESPGGSSAAVSPMPTAMPAEDAGEVVRLRVELAQSTGELVGLRALVVALRESLARLESSNDGALEAIAENHAAVLAAERGRAEDAKEHARTLAEALEAERARCAGLSAELAAVRAGTGQPWWRRLLTG